MSKLEPRDLERMRYHQGQMLRSRDFRDLSTNESHLRWWHNRALHQAYGIASGFAVEIDGDFIRVPAGVAYDAYGRELILAQEQRIRIPAHEETLLLLIRYATPGDACGQPHPAEICWPAQPTGAKDVEIEWRLERETSYRDGVRLARLPLQTTVAQENLSATFSLITEPLSLQYEAGVLSFDGVMSAIERDTLLAQSGDPQLSSAIKELFRRSQPDHHRRAARPLARPRVASGTTIPEATSWTLWTLASSQAAREQTVGFEVQIDTSAFGFTEIPCYFAWLQGPVPELYREFMEQQTWIELDSHVAEVSTVGFTFRLAVRVRDGEEGDRRRLQRFLRPTRRNQGLYVSWVGVQPAANFSTDAVG